jgi:sigma-B regulation protein RsbU (phosphoserine phosphatase)
LVSGDYCDLLSHGGDLYFVVGDVTGKGVSAALLMTHLHATFRALVYQGLPLEQVVARASRLFCESSLTTHFATMACGKADEKGGVELGSAGHDPALIVRGRKVERFGATGLPLGMFCDEQFSIQKTLLNSGEYILLYTDGLTESRNPAGEEYGIERLVDALKANRARTPQETITSCIADAETFRSGAQSGDDLTVMAIRRL